MSIKQVKFSHSEHEFRTLAEWEEELSIPANTLLHHASQGHLQPFIKPHFIEVDYYSVHLSLFDPDQTLEALEEIPRNYLPMHMGLDPRNVLGLVLGKEECASLSHGVEIKGAQHYSAILYKNMLWVDTLAPFPGRLENPTRPEDWRIAGYLNSMTYHSNDKKQFPWNPLSQTVLPRGGFIRDSDMKAFLSKLRSHEFISDLYRDGKIIEDRDVYPNISKRLGEIIDANWLYWKNYESIPNEEKERRQSRMIEYFNGNRRVFELPVVQEGTGFQQKVWSELMNIPFGKTISYTELSRRLGDPKVIRAAAAANGKNNVAIIVPCHRVIGANSELVGYAGGLKRKKWLLEHEKKIAHGVLTLF